MGKVYFIDVTNRDGVQTSRINLAKLQKTMINIYLAEMGVHQSEFGFPFIWHERNYIEANIDLKKKGAMGDMILEGWVRAIVQDVKGAFKTRVRHLNLSISTSNQMIRRKFKGKISKEGVLEKMAEAVQTAKDGGIETVGVNAEDASRTEMDYLVKFGLAATERGANRLRYCDTIGKESPYSIYRRVKNLAEEIGIDIELHCHNDLGMAVANSIAGARGAIDAGVNAFINTTVNGIGERAGQADLLSCILALKYAEGIEGNLEIGDELNLKVAWKLSHYVADSFGVPLPINQPGVGANAFAHESGIHADGALKDRENYELFDYTLLGREEEMCEPTGRIITTGEYGGMAGFKHVYKKLGIEFTDDDQAMVILNLVQAANAHTQRPLTDDELRFIALYPEETKALLTVNVLKPEEYILTYSGLRWSNLR
ncbi:MAG: homocitrate synthase [Candidatus Methanofastidiosia archaeon]